MYKNKNKFNKENKDKNAKIVLPGVNRKTVFLSVAHWGYFPSLSVPVTPHYRHFLYLRQWSPRPTERVNLPSRHNDNTKKK